MLEERQRTGLKPLPMIRSAEAAECGLACMAMVAQHHGHDIDLNGLRQRHAISMSGATLGGLMEIAEAVGLSARAVRAELGSVKNLRLPAVIHWNLDHFVVLKSVKKDRYIIHDPNRGVRSFSRDEFSNHFTGVAVEFARAAHFRALRDRSKIKLSSLWSEIQGGWGAFFQIFGLSLVLQILVFAAPFQMQLVVDEAVMRSDKDLLVVLALAFGTLAVLQSAIELLRAYSAQFFSSALGLQVAGNIVHHLIRLKSQYFEKRHVGDILSRMSSASSIQSFISKGLISTIIDGIMVFFSLFIMIAYSPLLSFVVILSLIVNAFISIASYPTLREKTKDQIIEQAREQSHLMETVRSAITIKIMGRERTREAEWRNRYANVVNANIAIGTISMSLSAVQSAVLGLQTVIVIFLGARAVMDGDGLSVGMLFAFMSFRQTFSDRTSALLAQAMQLRFMDLHLDRLADIVTAEREPDGVAAPLGPVKGEIELRDVSFRYGATDPLVLKHINLAVGAGEFVAFTGLSGGGKTTLTKLMLGLISPQAGEIRLEGQVATPALFRSWRQRVGVVAQDDRLLSGSIADNIAFFDPDLSMDQVRAAAVAAQLDEQIMQMPMQYLSLIGDMGSALSGGQRQRVLLARALYRQPSILVLDEGTANLDEATEDAIADLIGAMTITRIVVAHRPALLRRADRVIQVARGEAREIQKEFRPTGTI